METRKTYKVSDNIVRSVLNKWPIYQRYRAQLNEKQQSTYVMFLQAFNKLSEEQKNVLLERYFKGTLIKVNSSNQCKELDPLRNYRTQVNDYGHKLTKECKKELKRARRELKFHFSELFGDDDSFYTESETKIMDEFNSITADYQLDSYDYLYPAGNSTEEKQNIILNDILNGLTREIDYKKTKEKAKELLKGYKQLKATTGGVVTDLKPYYLTDEERDIYAPIRIKAIEVFNEVTSVINSLEEIHKKVLVNHFIKGISYKYSEQVLGGKTKQTYYRILNDGLVEFMKRYNNGEYVVYNEIASES